MFIFVYIQKISIRFSGKNKLIESVWGNYTLYMLHLSTNFMYYKYNLAFLKDTLRFKKNKHDYKIIYKLIYKVEYSGYQFMCIIDLKCEYKFY